MKHMKYIWVLSLLMAGVAQASVLTVSNWDGHNTNTYMTVWTVTAAADGNDILYSWSRTGDLDGLGGADDTLTFDLRHKAFTGSSFSSPDVTLGTSFDLAGAAAQHFGPGGDLDNNQSFQLSIESISFTQGESLGWVASFDGFTDLAKYTTEDETVYFGTIGAEVVTNSAVTFPSAQQVLTVSMIGSDNGNRFRDLDFSVTTAIPEPATLGLVAFMGGGLFFIRRLIQI